MDRRLLLQLGLAASIAPAGEVWASAPGLGAVDRLELEGLLGHFGWRMDTGDGDGLVALMTPDGEVVDRRGKRWSARGFATQYAGADPRRGRQHEVQLNSVERRADGAVVLRSYWASVVWAAGSAGAVVDGLGTYEDLCVRTGGRWMMRERRIGTWDSATVHVPAL